MKKVLVLGLICLFIFVCCKSPADPEIEKILKPPVVSLLPMIVSFTAESPQRNRYFTISWEVENATSVRIYGGTLDSYVSYPLVGSIDVWLWLECEMPVTFRLSTSNDVGLTEASIEVEPERAIFEIITIPEMPIFHYYYSPSPWDTYSDSVFTVVATETNGIGGSFLFKVVTSSSSGICPSSVRTQWQYPSDGQPISFEPYEVISHTFSITVHHAACKPTGLKVGVEGYDNNKMEIDKYVNVSFIWGD